ncbi:MAG TPA: Gfo/Idh/MocA family oxidoreductase [Steroidobacteraceae bacterium]|nr:Gfo/Idh/MocA family oxidoreductase [Steroidobacteraceae bacterium]
MTDKPIRYGMVGGGPGAFIGAVHRMAARLEGRYELLAGAFSSHPQRSRAAGEELGLAPGRVYDSYQDMARLERAAPDGIEAVVIVTPNHLHYPVAKAFLSAGVHVICDKPLTTTLAEAEALREQVRASGRLFFVTYSYGTYPMVAQAREMVRTGQLGAVRLVQVEYAQGWLSTAVEATGSPQARWRTDPALAGGGGCLGDIGTHAYHLAEFVTGLRTQSVAAELTAFVPGRRLDDNVQVLLRFDGGARGSLWASQVAAGEDNALRIRVYGERASLCWDQEHPEELRFAPLGSPPQTLRRGGPGVGPWARGVTRLPIGHPEGTLEGFGLLYSEVADAILAVRAGRPPPATRVATIDEGVAGMRFIEACLRSARQDAAWVSLDQ